MPFTFHKSFKLFPGVRLNLGKKSASVTVGGRRAKRTWSTTGRRTTSVNLPGPIDWRTTDTPRRRRRG